MELIGTYKKQFKCSMLRDLEWRRPMEIEALNGMVVKLGQACRLGHSLQPSHLCLHQVGKPEDPGTLLDVATGSMIGRAAQFTQHGAKNVAYK